MSAPLESAYVCGQRAGFERAARFVEALVDKTYDDFEGVAAKLAFMMAAGEIRRLEPWPEPPEVRQ